MKGDEESALDELVWLEAPCDQAALSWGRERTRRFRDRFAALPLYEELRRGLETMLLRVPREPPITILGNQALRLLNTRERPFGLFQTARREATGALAVWRTVLDMDELRKETRVPYELVAVDYWLHEACLPPDYNRCLLRLAPAGGVEVEIREFDLEAGQFVPGGFEVPRSHAVIQWLNSDLVLVGETSHADAPRTAAGMASSIKLWRRGEPLAAAEVVFQAAPTDSLVWLAAAGTGMDRYGVIYRAIDLSTYEICIVDQNGRVAPVPLPNDSFKPWSSLQPVHAGPKAIFLQLRRDIELAGKHYPANALISYAVHAASVPSHGDRVTVAFLPAPGEFLDGPAVATGDCFAFVVKRDLVSRVMVASAEGDAPPHEVIRTDAGQSITRLVSDHQSEEIVVTTEGFVSPSRQLLYAESKLQRALAEDAILVDDAQYVTEIGAATSRDGTQIDYYLLRPRAREWQGSQPLLVTGYAAFAASFAPTYFGPNVGGPSLKSWLERGGSLLIPAARGGGERGDEWHRAAMRERRQNSYDDFICAIEKLQQLGYTEPRRTGVFGLSNGGLVAAVLATQRPELFGAVVCDVPLADLVRMKHMGVGGMWTDEYGDPADPHMRKILESYSPLQNIRAGVRYPPFFITVSTSDSCVGPGHGRKLAARLESLGATVHFYEAPEGGHSISDPYRNSELMALRMTFLVTCLMSGSAGSESSRRP
jgi:prolyl oligopeptidase